MALICFVSPKGGVGKTTLAANVAANLAADGARVVALDLDPQCALGLHFGQDLHAGSGFVTGPPAGRSDLPAWQKALVRTQQGVQLLPSGRFGLDQAVSTSAALASRQDLLREPLVELLGDPATFVIADAPPGPSIELATLAPYADLFLTVLLADAASTAQIPSIESGLAYGRGMMADRISFVLNQVDNRSRLGRTVTQAATHHLGKRLLGTVYRDEYVAEALAAQRPLREYASNSKAAGDIARLSGAIRTTLSGLVNLTPTNQPFAAPTWPPKRRTA